MSANTHQLQNQLFQGVPNYKPKEQKHVHFQNEEQKEEHIDSTDEKVKLAQAALATITQTNQMAAEANLQVHHQGEQLERINDSMNNNQNKLGKIDYIQKNIKSGWGQFMGLFTKPKTVDMEEDKQQFNKSQSAILDAPQPPLVKQTSITQLTNEQIMDLKGKLTKEDRDRLYDEINAQVLQLQAQHKVLNQALTQQNGQLDHIDHKVEGQQTQMKKIQQQGQKILNK